MFGLAKTDTSIDQFRINRRAENLPIPLQHLLSRLGRAPDENGQVWLLRPEIEASGIDVAAAVKTGTLQPHPDNAGPEKATITLAVFIESGLAKIKTPAEKTARVLEILSAWPGAAENANPPVMTYGTSHLADCPEIAAAWSAAIPPDAASVPLLLLDLPTPPTMAAQFVRSFAAAHLKKIADAAEGLEPAPDLAATRALCERIRQAIRPEQAYFNEGAWTEPFLLLSLVCAPCAESLDTLLTLRETCGKLAALPLASGHGPEGNRAHDRETAPIRQSRAKRHALVLRMLYEVFFARDTREG